MYEIEIERIVNELPELLNYPSKDDSYYIKIAKKWINLGFSSIEVWDWICNGYNNPERVLYLKSRGQNVLHINDYVHTIINSNFGDLATINIDENMDEIYINFISVNEKEKGIGSFIFQYICLLADSLQKDIILSPSDEFGSDYKRLVRFYERFGFAFEKSGHNKTLNMRRKFKIVPLNDSGQ